MFDLTNTVFDFFLAVIFFQFLVFKSLDPDWIRIRIQPKMLDLDPDQMNFVGLKHWVGERRDVLKRAGPEWGGGMRNEFCYNLSI